MPSTHEMPFGARLVPGGAAFALWSPGASKAELLVERGAAWQAHEVAADAEGWRRIEVPGAAAGTRYRWRIDGGLEVPDPASRFNPEGPHGPSEVIDPAFDWGAGWLGRPWHGAVIYELHVGTFTPEGTYRAAEARLPALAQLGITAVELMPLGEFPGPWGWGYDGVLPYAPHARYGRPEDLKHFIRAAHAAGLMVFVDVVYNHFGPDGNYLQAYAPQFASAKHQTPWGAALNFDGEGSRWVREFMIHNALYWLGEYRCDGLRLDAVHAMVDDGQPHVLEELSRRVRAAFPGRHVHLTLENDTNDATRLAAPGTPGRYEGQWNGDFHHPFHVLATGEQHHYYAAYERGTGQLARVLTRGFAYDGGPEGMPGATPRKPAGSTIDLAASINFLQCHDQVGNRAHGERLAHLTSPESMRLMMAMLLLAPGVPMLFMGEEFDSARPFHFFADPSEALREAIRQGRAREFGHAGDLPDPCGEATFAASRIESPGELTDAQRAFQEWVGELLALRRRVVTPLLTSLQAGRHEAARYGERALRVRWRAGGGRVLEVVANLGPEPSPTVPDPDGWPALAYEEPVLAVGGLRRDDNGSILGPWAARWRRGLEVSAG